MKKILLGLLWIITLWFINFSNASYTAVINNQSILDWANINVSDIYNQYWDWILCVSSVWEWLLVIYFNEYWDVFNSINLNIPNSKSCVFSDGSFPMFSIYNWNWYYSYYVAWQSSSPSCEIHIWFSDIENNNSIVYLNDIYTPDWIARNYEFFYNSDYNTIDISNEYKNWEILINSWVSLGCWTCETDLLNCGSQLNTLSWNYNSCLSELNSCMSNSWTNCSWTWTNWSALFINNIQHLWKPIINITIPEEINWDYNSTWDLFDLNVVWYNVDYDKINWIINLQNTKPTEEDFNKIVSEVVPLLVPWLFIIAFIYFVFRFIRKLF